jgi:hypothetical protein
MLSSGMECSAMWYVAVSIKIMCVCVCPYYCLSRHVNLIFSAYYFCDLRPV